MENVNLGGYLNLSFDNNMKTTRIGTQENTGKFFFQHENKEINCLITVQYTRVN